MKKIFVPGLCIFMVMSLTSCSVMSRKLVPNKVSIENTTYRTGFYGDLWPQNLEEHGESYTVRGIEYFHIKNEKLDLVHSDAGTDECGVLYCNESQYEKAAMYYRNPDNFVFYCMVGSSASEYEGRVVIEDFDSQKFDELSEFAIANSYNPFDKLHNSRTKTLHLPIPDFDTNPPLVFYKESTDGYFTSFKGNKYHIIDDQLYLLFYYDYGHGEYEEMQCVQVPEEISKYIVELVQSNDFRL